MTRTKKTASKSRAKAAPGKGKSVAKKGTSRGGITARLILRKAIVDSKLGNLQERLEREKSGRDSFSITIVPEK